MKILIVKRDKLGDLILATSMMQWLRKALPEAQIDVLANDYNAWILQGNPNVDKVWAAPRVKHAGRVRPMAALATVKLLWQLRNEHYDWVLVGNGDESRRAIERGLWVKGKNTVAYCHDASQWPKLTHTLTPNSDQHESIALAKLAEPLGLSAPKTLPYPRYTLPEADAAFATKWLSEKGLAPQGYVALGLGARRSKRQPSTEQILGWAEQIHTRFGLKTVLMWPPGQRDNQLYPGDDETVQPILNAKSPHIIPFRGELNEALGLIWQARSSLMPDGGLMHFAATSPGGVVGFFAEIEVSPPPVRWAPKGPNVTWLIAPTMVSEIREELVLEALAQRIEFSTSNTPLQSK